MSGWDGFFEHFVSRMFKMMSNQESSTSGCCGERLQCLGWCHLEEFFGMMKRSSMGSC